MTLQQIITMIGGLIGGLAMFMYGMNVMSGGLTKLSGGRLESLLASITNRRFIAYLFGIGITALVQSSSASTVMVVGLVNSGIMTLAQAVNVILGANLGTTFTAWLLSLNAINSSNFFINLFKPETFTPYLALVGIILFMFTKTDKKQNVGVILLGFSVLMFGMQTMSAAMDGVRESKTFVSFLTSFSNPLIGFAIGIGFTMIIQSSAATIGIVQALSLHLPVTYAMAIPVVIGAEVGTCITAILSALGASKEGKRTALMHLYFNFIKAGCFMILFYSLNFFFHFSFLQAQAGMVGIASIHTLVNLVFTPLMLPFSGILVDLAMKTIPETSEEQEEEKELSEEPLLTALDSRFLTNPPFALQQSKTAAVEMAKICRQSVVEAMSLIWSYSKEVADKVAALEERADKYEDQIGTYLMKIISSELTVKDNRETAILLHSITDFERISDHALNISETGLRMHKHGRAFTDRAKAELEIYSSALMEILDMAVGAFESEDVTKARQIEPLEEVIDRLQDTIRRHHIKRLQKNKCTVEQGFDLTDIGRDYERIADHCSNIGISILEAEMDEFDTHEYVDNLDKTETSTYEHQVEAYMDKYRLPKKAYDENKDKDKDQEKSKPKSKDKDKAKDKVKDKDKKKDKNKNKSKDKNKDKKKDKCQEPPEVRGKDISDHDGMNTAEAENAEKEKVK